MQDNKVLKLVYTFFLGLLLAIFVGVGIATFYPGPTEPEYPVASETYGKEPTDEQLAAQRAYDQEQDAYQDKMQHYSRNVSIITLLAAVLFLVASIVLERKIQIIADGVMLGGLFTLLYSIIRGFISDNSRYVFLAVTIGLVVVLYLGYHRFVHEPTPKTAAAKK